MNVIDDFAADLAIPQLVARSSAKVRRPAFAPLRADPTPAQLLALARLHVNVTNCGQAQF